MRKLFYMEWDEDIGDDDEPQVDLGRIHNPRGGYICSVTDKAEGKQLLAYLNKPYHEVVAYYA